MQLFPIITLNKWFKRKYYTLNFNIYLLSKSPISIIDRYVSYIIGVTLINKTVNHS